MNTKCPILITRGPNKGKPCWEVHRVCMHKEHVCHCGERFNYTTLYTKHLHHCPGPATSTFKPKPKTKLRIVSGDSAPPPQINITNVTNLTYNFIGTDIFDTLVSKLGRTEAVNFITNSTATGRPLAILRKTYLDGGQADYPFAYFNGHYRYLDDRGQLVDSTNEQQVTQIIRKQIHDAMIKASNELIKHCLASDSVNDLYEIYDIGKIQASIMQLCGQDLTTDLKHEITNPDHSFFQGDRAVIMLAFN